MLSLLVGGALAATIQVTKVNEVSGKDLGGAAWTAVPETAVPLLAQNITYPQNTSPSISAVNVKAIADDQWLAVRVRWTDSSMDDEVEVDNFTDGVAIEIPLGDPKTANPMMGMKDNPMYIVNWKAVWQSDVEHGHADVQDYHPGFYTDAYPFATGQYPYPVQQSFETSDARRYLVATSAGNPMSVLQRRWPVEELLAEGFGTLASHKMQDAQGWGEYKNGEWTVVLLVPRTGHDPSNPNLAPGTTTALGFAVWDGVKNNVGGRKHWSVLNELVLP